ncbi:laminin subunit alpha-3-like isoform X1 [Larimichthys crocea]|uniref:laminin subunit alpha-3-like isoform X1 n=1 Tax=Larimichthys crocea TaxID=215358 RepID=UPI000F5E679A|nr:laminin subunit alpha-3-like isoform X1 [Larimichthys crocea]
MSYYIGGLPALLRQRHNITAPPLRGCVSHLTEDAEFVISYNKTIGVTHGCPNLALSIRSATLYSPLPVDSLFDRGEQSLRVSVGFRSTDTHGVFLRSSSQASSVHDLQLSLADGYAVFNSDNYVVRSDKRYNDGSWHYLSAVRRPTGLELSIDNVRVTQGQSSDKRSLDRDMQGGNFTGCITNLYTRRPNQQLLPADLSLLSLTEDVVLGRCSLHPPSQTEVSPPKHEPLQAPAGSRCKRRHAQHGEYQLSGEHSWLSYNLPQQDLNYRPHFALDIKTNSSKGLILHAAGRGVVPLLALYLVNGKLRMSLGKNRIIQHKQKSNDGNWHRVQLSVEKSSFHLLVDGVRVTDGHLPDDAGSSLNFHNPVYLGGDPMSKTTKGHNVPMSSVIGCIRDFKLNEEDVGEPEASHVTLPCVDRFTEMGTFFGGGHIILDDYFFTTGSQFELAFELRPRYLTGLLFHVQNHNMSLDVFLNETEVGLEMNDGTGPVRLSVTPPESLCDGKFHMITVSKRSELITLAVDSTFEQRTLPSALYTTALDSVYIGGTTNQNRASVSSPFIGCLRNVNLNGRPVVFETGYRLFGSVGINSCPAD